MDEIFPGGFTRIVVSLKKVLLIYPWGIDSVIKKNIGAGVRVGLLADYLSDNGYTVTVFSVGRVPASLFHRNISFIQVSYSANMFLLLLYIGLMGIAKIFGLKTIKLFMYYYFFRIDRCFKRSLKKIISKNDIVLLEYPFWSKIVSEVCDDYILTNHDFITKAWCDSQNGFFHDKRFQFFLKREISALKKASAVVAVSQDEKKIFESFGMKNTVLITNPVLMPDIHIIGSRKNKLDEYNINSSKPMALFVVSGWYPNKHAVDLILNNIAPQSPGIQFYIAGECAEFKKSNLNNVVLMGKVSDDVLDFLYRKSTFVVIPLMQGSGVSVKTIEAMAYGKVVVSTEVGARQIDFKDRENGILCKKIEEFSINLNELLGKKNLLEKLSKNARHTAKQYDYKTVFHGYKKMIKTVYNI
ncbi:MAG: glycosyltransferase family 4 protein [Desulfobacula sp.]|nr:glycosyltransferase family 4 protein [Desulfobacula sp.]